MNELSIEGIVLRATPFKENDRIVTLFTPEFGVMSLYVKNLSRKKPTLTNLTTPLARGEFVFSKGRSDLFRFLDGTLIDLHRDLRRSYAHLEVGGKMVQSILATQMPGKSAPALYRLLALYLKALSTFSRPETLGASFMLKLLKHEGLLSFEEKGLTFTASEKKCLEILAHARTLAPLETLEITPAITKGVQVIYETLVTGIH
ncbi:MAG: DNA repair protein RecO [Chlamydiia bacterium]|nr:DNA repair protein RecO [Chlamydiia bacterium]